MPPFTPLQLKINIKDHHDLGFNLVSKKPIDAERPTPAVLIDRRPATIIPATPSNTSTPTASTSAVNVTRSAAMADDQSASTPSLPPITSLPTAPMKTIITTLDLLFEPSTELHTLALPAIQTTRRLVPANPGLSPDLPPPSGAPPASIPNPSPSARSPYASYADLIDHIGSLLSSLSASSPTDPASKKKLHAILASHPRLGASKVHSAQSRAEQANLQSSSSSDPGSSVEEEAQKLRALNAEYEACFPGLRYVVFVNGRSRPAVMADMRTRIDRGDAGAEEGEAIAAMVDIAKDRAGKLRREEVSR